jgi:hypothetical protein
MKYCRSATIAIIASVISFIGILAHAGRAKADTDRSKDERTCQAAYRSAQDSEQSGLLREARAAWGACARPTCGSFLRQECTSRFTQLGSDIPSVVPVVTDAAGEPLADVQLRVDGELFAEQLDGRALQINPGLHEFAFSTQAGVFSTQKIMILQGQRNRLVAASLPAPRKPAQKPARHRLVMEDELPARERAPERAAPAGGDDADAVATAGGSGDRRGGHSVALPLVLVGAGLAAAGAGGVLIYWGRADNSQLAACTPNCSKASVDHIRRLYLEGDVALGVGAAALVGAFYAYMLSGGQPESHAHQQAHLFEVAPLHEGAIATWSGTF